MGINIWLGIAVLLLVILAAIIINGIEDNNNKNNSKMDFGTSMDLTGLPVVTFNNNGHKFNFLLDTGANLSVINSTVLESFVYTRSNKVSNLSGMEGNSQKVNFVNIGLDYKNYHFKEEFQVANMYNAFNAIKKESGVNISGILGSEFFRAHKYVLDFKSLVAYIKK